MVNFFHFVFKMSFVLSLKFVIEINFQIIQITYWREFIYLLIKNRKLLVDPYYASRPEIAIEWNNQT